MSNVSTKSDKRITKSNKRLKTLSYRHVVRPELSERLYGQIYEKIVVERKYADPNYSAKILAQELNTNTRYLSAVINSKFGKNFSTLINELRINDAKNYLSNADYYFVRIEDIGAKVGFSTRQCFYNAFKKYVNLTPRQYRLKYSIS